MNDEQQAAQSIGKFLQALKGLADLKPGLESLGSVKQAEQEVKSRLNALKIDEATLINKTKSLRVEITGLEKKAELIRDGAKADADIEVKKAEKLGVTIVEAAKKDMSEFIAKAKKELEVLQEQIANGNEEIRLVNNQVKAAKQRLDQTNAELDRIVQRAGGKG